MDDSLPLPQAEAITASPGYFQALGIPVRVGRDFKDSDRAGSLPVVIVNESMARHYWNGKGAIDRQISVDNGANWLTIVGVVADARKTLDADIEDSFYVPVDQIGSAGQRSSNLVSRANAYQQACCRAHDSPNPSK